MKSPLGTNYNSNKLGDIPNFPVVGEKVVYNGWRRVIQRDVILPSGMQTSYDIYTQSAPCVVVFVWNTITKTTTLLREFYPGPMKVMYGAAGGVYEEKKHNTPLECAQMELEEEAQLRSDTWIPLVTGGQGMPFDKYSDNILHPYLVLNCELVDNPLPMDAEEWIIVERDVSYQRLMDLITSGQLTFPTTIAALLGLRQLQELGYSLT